MTVLLVEVERVFCSARNNTGFPKGMGFRRALKRAIEMVAGRYSIFLCKRICSHR